MSRRLIVTHHAPDLDAVTSVWLLKRFDAQHFADAYTAFVDPGTTLSAQEVSMFDVDPTNVVHVDTGLGQFDHHQPDRGLLPISASSLVFDHVKNVHPDLLNDQALAELVSIVTEIDHFGEVAWPDANNTRYCLMLHDLLHGFESIDSHTDDAQLNFGLQCLDCAYASLKETVQAANLLTEGQEFQLKAGNCLGIETANDVVVKYAQKKGYQVVVRKDPTGGEVRIKARPDAKIDLRAAADKLKNVDPVGTWYYHPSGKMLLNGSRKHRNQNPTPLSLRDIIKLLKELYG